MGRQTRGIGCRAGLISRAGNLHDPALVDHIAVEADVLVVAIRASAQDGVRLADVIGSVAKTATAHGTRLGVGGGAGSLHVAEGGPRVVDLPTFPDARNSNISGADYAKAFVDEIEQPAHRRQRFSVAY